MGNFLQIGAKGTLKFFEDIGYRVIGNKAGKTILTRQWARPYASGGMYGKSPIVDGVCTEYIYIMTVLK